MLRTLQSEFSFLNATGPQYEDNDAAQLSDLDSDTMCICKHTTETQRYTKSTFRVESKVAGVHIHNLSTGLRSVVKTMDQSAIYHERRSDLTAPPKRFYLTFWRSIVRRMTQAERSDQAENSGTNAKTLDIKSKPNHSSPLHRSFQST